MKHNRTDDTRGEMLAAYLEGEVTPSEKAAIEAEIADSSAARRRLQSLRNIRDALSTPISGFDQVDLAASVRQAIQSPQRPSPWHAGLRSWYTGLVAAAACMLVLGGAMLLKPSQPEFRPKSGAAVDGRERWAGVQVYRVEEGGKPERLTNELGAGDGLLFSYTNLGREPFEYLMVFGVDARGEVRWCYPAFEQEGSNPTSIPIEKHKSNVPLPELIRHDFPPGGLEIHALFTSRPMNVLQIEALVKQSRGSESLMSLPDASDQVVHARVRGRERSSP